MSEIERIRDLDDEIFQEFQEYFPKTINSKFKKEFPITSSLAAMIDTSCTFIKNSVFDSCETDDYYGAKILFRSLIEHYIRFNYLFINWAKTKTDAFAKKYLEYGNAREVLDLIRAKVWEQQLFDSDFKIDDWDTFLKEHPNFKDKTRKEVEAETKRYSFKNIVKFLNVEFQKGDRKLSSFLGTLIIEYSNLSSYVHGGMKSYNDLMFSDSEEKRKKEYNRICGLAFQISNSVKLFTVQMYVHTDREIFLEHYLKIEKILKQIEK